MLVYPYKAGSKGAKALAQAVGGKRISLKASRLKGSPAKVVINWGSSELPPEVMKCTVLNPPAAVALASNKKTFFQTLQDNKDVTIPIFATDKAGAIKLLAKGPVVCRTVLQGHSGDGIVIAEKEEEIVNCSLFTQYIKKQQEYRVHVVKGQVVDVQRKARSREIPDDKVNWKVRNHKNGFVFVREGGVKISEGARYQAIDTIKALGLDFGAVDLIFNQHNNKYYVLEVNTAPGLEGQTIESYAKAFLR